MAIKLADTARPNNYVDAEHLGTYPVAYAEDVWFEDGTRLSEKTFDGQSIQVDELPLASETTEGKIYQFVGETGTYINGCFYKCVETTSNHYSWKLINVIDNPVCSIDDDIYSHFNKYDEGAVIVYTGEDTPSYQKGHHYRKVIRGSVPTYSVSVYQDAEHQTATPYQSLEPVIEVGTVLFYTDYNSGFVPQCKCIAISGDEYTWYRYSDGLTTRSLYGVHINTNPTSNLLTYWEDIGGGGGGSSEFIGTQAEWDALPQSQKDKYDGKIVNITDDDSGANLDYYSTTETKTNKVWIDGKPIYRKVVTGLSVSIPSDTWVSVTSSSNFPNLETIISAKGLANDNVMLLNFDEVQQNNNNIRVEISLGGTRTLCTLILEYTKTTD